MVLESVVADVLNRFLGDYVENLDRSQLKIGIWGGDVVLENLVLKQNALDELDLPVQTIFGHLGKLVLKIPWKNLYGASVEASIERLFLLVAPNQEVKYDEEKEERLMLQSKQSELQRVEEAKKREAQKDQPKVNDSFVEKLVTQIIKNVQLNIKDIHIRYEDKVTNPGNPFSLGVSLHNLSVNTTDETWKRCVLQEAVTKIYKVLDLEGLALYWNPNSTLYTQLSREAMLNSFQTEIAMKSFTPTEFKYILGPINASAKLKLNPKPELDTPKFEIPKCILNLDMDQLAIGITKAQYQDIMRLADSMDRMTKGMPYRKYRPFLSEYRGHYKEWWKFAYTCVLEGEVKRKRKNWDWNHISEHRNMCREYACAYQTKLQASKNKVPSDLECLLNKCEKRLDLFNLVVIRQRIEMEVERLGKVQEEANKKKGWFSYWWGGNQKDEELSDATDIMKKFEKAMTPEEKSKLFQAIDYQENSAPTHLPVEFAATECHFILGCLVLRVTDDRSDVLTSQLNNVQASLQQRPSANALKVVVRMQEFKVSGLVQRGATPALVTSKQIVPGTSLLDVTFETNPLDNTCGQRIKVSAQPLEMIYDAQTINKIVEVFKPPSESSALAQLQAAANSRLSNLKQKSALGLQYAVSQHTILDIDINFCSSYMIIPHSGFYTSNESCVVVNLGAVNITSAPRSEKAFNVHQLYKEGVDEEEIYNQAIMHSYDKFLLKLTDIQVVIAERSENWKESIVQSEPTSLHLLQPTTLTIEIQKCLITDDPRLPKMKVFGHLHRIAVNASEERLITMLEILVSIPFPKEEQQNMIKASDSRTSSLSLLKYFDPAENKKRQIDKKPKTRTITEEEFVQLTELEANFVMEELIVMVLKKSIGPRDVQDSDIVIEGHEKLISFTLNSLELYAAQRTLTLEARASLGGIAMTLYRNEGSLPLIRTARCDEDDRPYLFTVKYCNVDKKCPDFHSRHGSAEQLIELDFTILQVLLHQEGIQQLLKVATTYQARLNAVQGEKDRVASAGTPLSTIPEDQEMPVAKSKSTSSAAARRKRSSQVEVIGLKVAILMEQVSVEIATNERSIANMAVTGLKAGLIMKNSYTQVNATLQDIKIIDNNPKTIHKQIVSIVGGDALTVQIVLYNLDHYMNADNNDISVDAQISCIRIVFLNWFVTSMLNFLNNFQAAQQAIKDGSAMAVESAKANVQNAYEKATKIALQIQLKAPIVIAPENSLSYHAIMIDFGFITLTNKFIDIDVKEAHDVIIDELTLALDNLKLSRVELKENVNDISSEKMLLQPTTFNLIVKRNLSSWYSRIPDMDMSGRLKAIKVSVSNDDFKMIMKVLSENLTEGNQSPPTAPPQPERPQLKQSMSVESKVSGIKKHETAVYAAKSIETEQNSVTRIVIKFTFTMDSLTIEMRNKVTPSVSQALLSLGSKTDESGLARFSLLLLSVKGKMMSNNSMYTSLLLVDCLLDDIRPHRESKLTRFMQRKTESGIDANISNVSTDVNEKLRSMIDVTFTQKQSDIFMDVRVFSFNLILSMDFMMKIMEFITAGMTPAQPPVEKELSESIEYALTSSTSAPSRKVSKISVPEAQKTKEVVKIPAKEENKSGAVTINLKVEKPDIILVESMDNKDCQALILNNEITFKMRMTDQQKTMNGSINQFQLFTCQYGSSGAKESGRYSVLVPCDVTLNAFATDKSAWDIDITASDIRLNVSPATIDLLNRVLVTMTKSDDESDVKEDVIGVYKDLWDIKPFNPTAYWFLKTEEATEAFEINSATGTTTPQVQTVQALAGEICKISAPTIVLSIEAGLGNDTIPMLTMQASLQAQIKDWSGSLNLESTWAMQLSYYNESLALWEPLVEPVEVYKDNKFEHIPWELKLQVQMNKNANEIEGHTSPTAASPSTEISQGSIDLVDGETNAQQPAMSVQISSSEILELTVTNSLLQVLTDLGKSFSTAVKGGLSTKSSENSYPYLVKNDTGLSIALLMKDDAFTVYSPKFDSSHNVESLFTGDEVILEHGGSVPLQLKSELLDSTTLNQELPDWSLHIKILELECELNLPVVRADKRFFPLQKSTSPQNISRAGLVTNDGFGIISEVVVVEGSIHINIRSAIQVLNSLSVPVEVHFMTSTGNDVESLGYVNPNKTMNLPLRAVYTPTSELFFSVDGYNVSVKPFTWRDLQKSIHETKLLSCNTKSKVQKDRFFMKAVGVMEQVFLSDTSRHTMASACFNISLRPALVLQNTLPVDITVAAQGIQNPIEKLVKPGDTLHLPQVEPNSTLLVIMLPKYLDKTWVCTSTMPENAAEFSVWTFESHDSSMKMSLELGMHCLEKNGCQHFSLYSPFWMLNKTGLNLAYRKSRKNEKGNSTDSPRKNADELTNILYHPADYKEPILFSFKAKNFFGKKKASIRVENGDWSEKFSLDVPGSSGVIMCRHNGQLYQVGVSNVLTYNSLTKQVTFTPYFLLINNAPFDIECQEVDKPGDPYVKVDGKSSKAFWPKSEKDEKLMRVKAFDNITTSAPFIYTDQHSCLLKLNNQYGGIMVETQVSEGGIYVIMRQYTLGLAPALIINHTPFEIKLWEKDSVNVRTLKGMHNMLYAWENPAGPRIIVFEGFKKKEVENDLRKDGFADFMVGNEARAYWVSFLDAMQRVLLLTTDVLLAHAAFMADSGNINMEATISIHGLGLSLVNNAIRQEILYLSISSSGVIWEQCKLGTRKPVYKALPAKDTSMIEEAYQRFLEECEVAGKTVPGRALIDTRTEVDFETMEMLRPNKRRLRRTAEPGVWAQYGAGTHRVQLHARLHRLQIDQQLPAPTFPVILAPVPPPKSVGTNQTMKPFVELCIFERLLEHTTVKQYKYFKILVQEFHVKIDMGLINALVAMFPEKEISESEAAERFSLDIENATKPLATVVAAGTAFELKHFYDHFHLSPLKVHVSFSMGGSTQLPSFLGTVLQGLGVTLTDMNDVIFKLAYYERNYEFLSQTELISTVTKHYMGQAIKQLYVLVLGLDVIGNPYGLVVGLTKGVEDLFYEPIQGAIQGPEEFAQGVMLGVRSLFGHAVGGAAGAVSRIAGAMGHGLAALSLDEDYQRKRRDNINKPAANLQEGIARSGKGLLMGVVDGVTGVFTKPISGAREEGTFGFFKGVGKGAVGLVARPTAGVVDFASGSLDAVKRAADLNSEVTRIRPPRWLDADGLVRPYSKQSAEGYKLLRDFDKGKYMSTDLYVMHLWVVEQKEVVLLTDKRIAYLQKNNMFGGWQLEWSYTWQELPHVPAAVEKGVFVPVPDGKKKALFGKSTNGKLIYLYRDEQKKSLVEQCAKLIRETQ